MTFNNFFKELFKPLIYIYNNFIYILTSHSNMYRFNLLEPLWDECETEEDFDLLDKKYPDKLLGPLNYYWWKSFLYAFLTAFVNLHGFLYGIFLSILFKLGFKHPRYLSDDTRSMGIYFYKNSWFSIPLPYMESVSLFYISPVFNVNLSWDNWSRFFKGTNCLFFIFSSIYYIYNFIILHNPVILSKLFQPGCYFFLISLYLNILFLDWVISKIPTYFQNIVKCFPWFFEGIFFPLYYVVLFYERFLTLLIFICTFWIHISFIFIYFYWYILNFWINTSILVLSSSDHNLPYILSPPHYKGGSHFWISKFYEDRLRRYYLPMDYLDHLCKSLWYSRCGRVCLRIQWKSKKFPPLKFNQKDSHKNFDTSLENAEISVSKELMDYMNSLPFLDWINLNRYPVAGLDLKDYNNFGFIYPVYLVNFFTETVPYKLETYLSRDCVKTYNRPGEIPKIPFHLESSKLPKPKYY